MGAAVKPIGGGQRKLAKPRQRRLHGSPLDKARPHEVVWQQVSEIFERARRIEGVCFVYVISEEGDGPVKIGVAKDPIKRVRQMQTGNPRRLRIEHVLVGDRELEQLLHELWEPFAVIAPAQAKKVDAAPGTEWFRPDIRERLMPIIESAVDRQVEFLAGAEGEIRCADLEQCVRTAHADHDFVFKPRDVPYLLAAGAGYVRRGRGTRV